MKHLSPIYQSTSRILRDLGLALRRMDDNCQLRHAGAGRDNRFNSGLAMRGRFLANFLMLAMAAMAAPGPAIAADLSFEIVDRSGLGVGEVIVTATPSMPIARARPAPKSAVMDQRNLTFKPRVLVIEVGTSVEFPNSDSVSHQVYSFSAAKRFQLPLYKGEMHPPVTFNQPGLVVLGCNIHDSMVGYIYVTAAPYFGITEPTGGLRLEGLPAGDYRISIWSPFIADPAASLVRTVHIDGAELAPVRVQLSRPLRAQPEPKPHRREWEY